MTATGGIAGQFPAGEDHLVRRLAQVKADAREDTAAQIAAISGTVRRLAQTTTVLTSEQTIAYGSAGTQYTTVGPDWATHAMCVSSATRTATTINGDARIVLLHSPTAITAWQDYHWSLDIGIGADAGDFVAQGYPYLVTLGTGRTLYTRPWSTSLGATSGGTSLTLTTVVTWIAA